MNLDDELDDFDVDEFGSSSFGDSFDTDTLGDDLSDTTDTTDGTGNTKKTALIAIGVGIVGIIAVVLIANAIGKANNQQSATGGTSAQTTITTERAGKPVDDIMSSDRPEQVPSNIHKDSESSNKNDWIEITAKEQVTFDADYKELMFLVTDIHHLAKTVDTNSNLVIKTTLTGSLSGLTGSYTLDVPYSKGTKLVVGDEFAVRVQFGTYRGKKVIGEIIY